jgi:predicted regulator of Ras-like GTPase activity (Roadblock/LC7/MglB family)
MNKMQETLATLRRASGIKGAAVITDDGLVAASALEASTSPEAIAGLASYLLMTTDRALREGGMGGCSRVTLHASNGKAQFVELDGASLVVLFDQFADPAAARREVDDAAARLRRLQRLG